jgi:hypothetical protein
MISIENFNKQKESTIARLITDHISKVELVESQTYAMCFVGSHIFSTFATGGRDGHCISVCMACGHKEEGWD